jgi:hypothetical protein
VDSTLAIRGYTLDYRTRAGAVRVLDQVDLTITIKDVLVGTILWVTWPTIIRLAAVYAAIGLFHWILRRRFLTISFDPSTALCLKHTSAPDRSAPLVALCEPTRCPNACITARHRPVWARAADDARILLREKRLSELQRVALCRDLDRIESVLDGITTPASPAPPARSSRI